MAWKGNGSSGYVQNATGLAASVLSAYSFHFIYKNNSAPANATASHPFAINYYSGTLQYNLTMTWDHTLDAFRQSIHHLNADHSNYTIAKFVTSLQANTFYGIGGSWNGVQLKAYLNGVLEKTTAGSPPDTALVPLLTFLAFQGATVSEFDDGEIAEFGLWSAELTQADFNALASGRIPPRVRPDALQIYAPFVNDLVVPVRKVGGAFSASGVTSVTTHPRVIMMDDDIDFGHIDTANYPAIDITVSQGLGLVMSNVDPGNVVTGNVTFTPSLLYNATGNVLGEVVLNGKVIADSGDLAAARYKEKPDVRR